MRKIAFAALITAAVSACSADNRVARAEDDCLRLGFNPGTEAYAGCVERGYRAAKQGDNSTASTLTSLLMVLAVL